MVMDNMLESGYKIEIQYLIFFILFYNNYQYEF